jgi:hypothetical protein
MVRRRRHDGEWSEATLAIVRADVLGSGSDVSTVETPRSSRMHECSARNRVTSATRRGDTTASSATVTANMRTMTSGAAS